MLVSMGAISTLLISFLICKSGAVDIGNEREFDVELEDDIDILQSMDEVYDTKSRLEFKAIFERTYENDDWNHAYDHSKSFALDFDKTLVTRLNNLLRNIVKKHGLVSSQSNNGKCNPFRASLKTTKRCFTLKTFLGDIKACSLACKAGYHLAHEFPHYELCGAATNWRWTYQLRGRRKASETCLKGIGKKTKLSTCKTPNCFATAAYYMNKINYAVDPCEDFYEYGCGRWIKEAQFPAGSNGRYITYTVLRNRVVKNMAELLSLPIKRNEIEAIKKAKVVYQSCIDTERINDLDSAPLLDFLQQDLAWPVICEYWNPMFDFDLESTLATLRGRYHNNVLFTVRVGKSEGRHILQTWKGKMALPTKYYFEKRHSKRKQAYFSLMVDTAKMLGADHFKAYKDMRAVLHFEIEISKLKIVDRDFPTLKTISEMESDIPGIDWLRLFKNMIWTYPIFSATKLQVWNVRYLKDLIDLILKTQPRVVQNYMVWRIVKHRIPNLSRRFQLRYLQYKNAMYGSRSLAPRSDTCAKALLYSLKGPTGKMFLDKYFSPKKKKAAETMFSNIRKGFIHLLNTEVEWMDNKTKAYAKEKALAIKPFIGYNPRIYENSTYLNKELKHLRVSVYDYFGNVVRTLTQISQNQFKKLAETYNVTARPEFTTRPTMVNAFYDPRHNSLVLPAGEMQYPFYWGDEFPRMFQYGAIGTILGHEITHGFDNIGSKYDKYGRLKNWWSPSSLREFHKRTKCIQDQYNGYYWPLAGEYIDGTKSLGENIADNGGIREAYQGYQFWLKSKNITGEAIEPATGLTNNQMFFVGFSNVRCAKYSHLAAEHAIAVNTHSPGRFRVLGSLKNFDEFSKAFHCKPNSGMNPKNKCILW